MESIVFNHTAVTVTYDNDCIIPSTDYGEHVPVKVEVDTTDINVADKTITIVIGDKRFLPSEVQKWWNMIGRAQEMIESIK